MAAQNEQITAALNATRSQLDDLTGKVNTLTSRIDAQPPSSASPPTTTTAHRTVTGSGQNDSRLKKLQSRVNAQGKAIEETRSDLASTRSDLDSTRTELTGSIAHTHEELVQLQRKGERNYYEFDIEKAKQFQHEGPFGIRLRKANTKHQYADLELMVDDRNLTQKHVNLYQPVMFYTPDTPQPVEVVINKIGKDHIHGYVSAPKYRQSELASMSSTGNNPAISSSQAAGSNPPSSSRQKLPPPQ
jgi:uncharacterized coiled-coil protein SlyX